MVCLTESVVASQWKLSTRDVREYVVCIQKFIVFGQIETFWTWPFHLHHERKDPSHDKGSRVHCLTLKLRSEVSTSPKRIHWSNKEVSNYDLLESLVCFVCSNTHPHA